MTTHSFEVPASSLPIEDRQAGVVEKVDVSAVTNFIHVPLPASLVENFKADPSVLIEGYEDISRKRFNKGADGGCLPAGTGKKR